MLHLLLPEADDMTFLRKAKEILSDRLNNEWTELGQWTLLCFLLIGYFIRVFYICCHKGQAPMVVKDWQVEEGLPLQALKAIKGPSGTSPSAPRLYPRFGN